MQKVNRTGVAKTYWDLHRRLRHVLMCMLAVALIMVAMLAVAVTVLAMLVVATLHVGLLAFAASNRMIVGLMF
jgi:hypothetical protein